MQREINLVRSEQCRIEKEKMADRSGKGDEYMAKLAAEGLRKENRHERCFMCMYALVDAAACLASESTFERMIHLQP